MYTATLMEACVVVTVNIVPLYTVTLMEACAVVTVNIVPYEKQIKIRWMSTIDSDYRRVTLLIATHYSSSKI